MLCQGEVRRLSECAQGEKPFTTEDTESTEAFDYFDRNGDALPRRLVTGR